MGEEGISTKSSLIIKASLREGMKKALLVDLGTPPLVDIKGFKI